MSTWQSEEARSPRLEPTSTRRLDTLVWHPRRLLVYRREKSTYCYATSTKHLLPSMPSDTPDLLQGIHTLLQPHHPNPSSNAEKFNHCAESTSHFAGSICPIDAPLGPEKAVRALRMRTSTRPQCPMRQPSAESTSCYSRDSSFATNTRSSVIHPALPGRLRCAYNRRNYWGQRCLRMISNSTQPVHMPHAYTPLDGLPGGLRMVKACSREHTVSTCTVVGPAIFTDTLYEHARFARHEETAR
ncbi:hypothetical protein B0H14DRAFT_3707066 [Mycena olivaceomarginata]|nr:hypothetical protein B0H14DRAFT_3707066 [Mycena olivaceomarginata]